MPAPLSRTLRVLSLGFLLTAANAHAVESSADGFGDVLLFPYFSGRSDTQTLLTVTPREGAGGVALRVAFRFPLPADGERPPALLVDLLLRSADTWAVGAVGHGDAAALVNLDESCARAALAGDLHSSNAHGLVPLPAMEGWIEVYALGELIDTDVLNELERHRFDLSTCDEVWAAFDAAGVEGMARPGNPLRGNLHLVEVARATAYSVAPLALVDFRDHPIFPSTAENRPTLADVSPARARVALPDGQMLESNFESEPVDAVSAVLMAQAWEFDFTVEPHAAAATDLVVTLPTRSWYVDGVATRAPFAAHPHIAPGGAVEMHTRVFDREGRGLGLLSFGEAKCTPAPQNVPRGPKLDGELVVQEFGPEGLLGSVYGRTLLQWNEAHGIDCFPGPWTVWEEVESGRYSIRFDRAPELGIGRLLSDEGHVHLGQPVIGAVFTRLRYDDFGPAGVNNSYGLVQPITRTVAAAP